MARSSIPVGTSAVHLYVFDLLGSPIGSATSENRHSHACQRKPCGSLPRRSFLVDAFGELPH